MMILCTACKFCLRDASGIHCQHPVNLHMSLVNGKESRRADAEFCRSANGHCRPEAEHFEARLEVA